MRTSKIKELIKLVEESGVEELEVSLWGRRVRIRKKAIYDGGGNGRNPQVEAIISDRITGIASDQKAADLTASATKKNDVLEIKTPMVGTFYRAPSPDAKPFVQVGDRISRGQTICIIEAMKIMNEIESEYDGVVVDLLVQNSQPVQFGQPLFRIEPASSS